MANDIRMGNAPFIDTPSSPSTIETIFSWVRQIFGVIEPKLNKHTIQIADFFKKKQASNKTELKKKKKTCVPNGWFSNHITKIKTSTSPNYNASPSGRISPTPTFTFTIEWKEILTKLPTYDGKKKINHDTSRLERNFKWSSSIYQNGTDSLRQW